MSIFRNIERAGDVLFVIGMVGRDPGGQVVTGIEAQTLLALQRIEAELAGFGRDRGAIVRLRFFVVDMRLWPPAREVVRDFFDGSVPPSTAVGVTGLADTAMLIEIEAEAAA